MNVLEELLKEQDGAMVGELQKRFNLDGDQTLSALKGLLPAIAGNMKQDSLSAILGSLAKSNLGSLFDNPAAVQDDEVIAKGNDVLGELLGSKEVSRNVASQAAEKSGVSSDILKKMLPVVASMVVGMMTRKASADSNFANAADRSGQGGLGGMLTSFLDADNDGSIVDDVLGSVAKRLF